MYSLQVSTIARYQNTFDLCLKRSSQLPQGCYIIETEMSNHILEQPKQAEQRYTESMSKNSKALQGFGTSTASTCQLTDATGKQKHKEETHFSVKHKPEKNNRLL